MSNKQCEDGSEVSWWGATKSIFKIVGCGLNAAAKATETMAIEASKLSVQANDASVIFLVETMGIYNSDGSKVDNPGVAHIIADAYKSDREDTEKILKLAEVLNLDASEFVENYERSKEAQKLINEYRK